MLNRRYGPAGPVQMVRLLRLVRLVRPICLALAVGLLAGCAAGLPAVERPASMARAASPDAPLATLARDAGIAAGQSGVYPLPQASFALDARLALIANAHDSLDLQCYVIADDGINHLILRGLRDAAQRGVRVRLLIDDLHTTGMDRLLLGLAAEPNVEVRVFNPFASGRESTLARALGLLLDLGRLNHRMYNKLFIADGSVVIVGGRNLANEYFLRGTKGNFIDFDLLVAGAVLAALNGGFDAYWNSAQACPLQAIAAPGNGNPDVADDAADATLRAAFEVSTRPENTPAPPPATNTYGMPPLSTALAAGRVKLVAASGRAFADSPAKADPQTASEARADTVGWHFLTPRARGRRAGAGGDEFARGQ